MSYAFEIKMICGGYVYFSTYTRFDGYAESSRERRKPSSVNEEDFLSDLVSLGHSVFGVEDAEALTIWLKAKGWALVDEEFAKKEMQQWLKAKECISTPTGVFTDTEIVSPKTLRRSFYGKIKRTIIERDGGRCIRCGSEESLTMQHVIPYARGGETTSRNLITLCSQCNQSIKSNIDFTGSDAAGLHRDYERSIINHNWYSVEQERIATRISNNLMQTRCEVW